MLFQFYKTEITHLVFVAGVMVCCAIAANAKAQAIDYASLGENPSLPELLADEKRVRVALVDSGVNYLLPEISNGLARDSEGKLIGYDFWDMDDKPFDSHPLANGRVIRHGTKTASLLLREAPEASLVVYRYPRPDMTRMRQLIQHAVDNDVRVIGLPLGSNKLEPWHVFAEVAEQHPDILFVASAGNNGRDIDQEPVYPAALDLANLLVVTSADDFARPADGVNWGRNSVDYMVPAEDRSVLEFDGSEGRASGSSYAVPRVVALAARLIEVTPDYTSVDILKWIRQRFADGTAPRQIGSGYLADPLVNIRAEPEAELIRSYVPEFAMRETSDTESSSADQLSVPLELIVLNSAFDDQRIDAMLDQAADIFSQCAIAIPKVEVYKADVAAHQQYLATGPAKTVMQSLRSTGPKRKLTIVLAHDTRMQMAFDAEAFGRANTRNRSWLTDSVWLTAGLRDDGIALAHEMFHVLANSGDHSSDEGNLMLARTTGKNTSLTAKQCMAASETALRQGLIR